MYGNNYTDDDLKRMFNEKLHGNTGQSQSKPKARRLIDCGELVLQDDGVYRSRHDFPNSK